MSYVDMYRARITVKCGKRSSDLSEWFQFSRILHKKMDWYVSFGEDREQAEALLALAKDVTETEGGERDRNIARLVWQAVKMASTDADLEKDVGDLMNEFTESFRD